MLEPLFSNTATPLFLGVLAAFVLVFVLLKTCAGLLPRDGGREYAHNGALSQGKPRGAGFVFVLVFAAVSLLVLPFSVENLIYTVLLIASMMTGYLDDGAKKSWDEYKKGALDLIIAILLAVTYLNFNPSQIRLEILNITLTLPPVVFGILTVVLVWVSINVTNCTDGVDGLSASVSIVTMGAFYVILLLRGRVDAFGSSILIFAACLLSYLWFNAHPSGLMMGDAGSRAMGLFIAVAALKSGSPLLYLLCAAVLIIDGGMGLLKVSLLRFLKIRILKNVRTPIHDHVRKNKGWSDTQTVMRFTVLQLVLAAVAVYFVAV